MYKNNCSISGLTKGRCKFTTSDFPAENPHTHTTTSHTKTPLGLIVMKFLDNMIICNQNFHTNLVFPL